MDLTSRRFSQVWPLVTASADDRYLSLCAQRNRTTTPAELRSSLAASSGRLVIKVNHASKVSRTWSLFELFVFFSHHTIGGNVSNGHVNMSTGYVINGGLFSLRMSPGLASKAVVGVVSFGENL
ncbi:hypothetical protein TNCV_3832371 [Trichonephila clavipes]|nr:hypothetical protein TNCV_3832371 [Trichonephila clavipes]